jgi:hypothetical protein
MAKYLKVKADEQVTIEKVDKETPLGIKMKDTVTGFEGIAIAKVIYLNGCVQYSLKPKIDKDGKIQDAQTFDSQQLVILDEGILTPEKKNEVKKPTGGDMPDTPRIR